MSAAWKQQALCRGMDPELFFPERGANTDFRVAQAVCRECPVRSDCLEYGLVERFGIWGGEGEISRRRIKVLRRVSAA